MLTRAADAPGGGRRRIRAYFAACPPVPMSPETVSPFGARRYNAWNDAVKRRYGARVQKVSIDAGFTCPNRDGLLGSGGCTFCNNAGFMPGYLDRRRSIAEQIDAGLDFLRRRYPQTQRFIAYFQGYSNTYGEFARLREHYQEALAQPQISGLAIGTRPDCLPDAVLDYLAQLAREHIVELEIGVESCDDAALARVNRGHDFAASADAIGRAAARGLEVTAHLILGLPGETRASMLAGAGRLSMLPLKALKLHQLQLVRGTALARQWQDDPASVPLLDADAYLELLADFVERLAPRILLQRLGSEVPPALKLAPHWNMRLSELAPRLTSELARRGTWQGCRYAPPDSR
jgi:radical SAM protein (TIGR01212 family)